MKRIPRTPLINLSCFLIFFCLTYSSCGAWTPQHPTRDQSERDISECHGVACKPNQWSNKVSLVIRKCSTYCNKYCLQALWLVVIYDLPEWWHWWPYRRFFLCLSFTCQCMVYVTSLRLMLTWKKGRNFLKHFFLRHVFMSPQLTNCLNT